MKIYTEKQVRKAIELAQKCVNKCDGVYFKYTQKEIIDELTNIKQQNELIEKSSIELLIDKINSNGIFIFNELGEKTKVFTLPNKEIFEQVEEMHIKEIFEARENGFLYGRQSCNYPFMKVQTNEQYYNEKFRCNGLATVNKL